MTEELASLDSLSGTKEAEIYIYIFKALSNMCEIVVLVAKVSLVSLQTARKIYYRL